MNEEIREPKEFNTEDEESNGSSRSPGVTDRGLISREKLPNKNNPSEPSKDSKTVEPNPNNKTV